jgi:hypothetical protein
MALLWLHEHLVEKLGLKKAERKGYFFEQGHCLTFSQIG